MKSEKRKKNEKSAGRWKKKRPISQEEKKRPIYWIKKEKTVGFVIESVLTVKNKKNRKACELQRKRRLLYSLSTKNLNKLN